MANFLQCQRQMNEWMNEFYQSDQKQHKDHFNDWYLIFVFGGVFMEAAR